MQDDFALETVAFEVLGGLTVNNVSESEDLLKSLVKEGSELAGALLHLVFDEKSFVTPYERKKLSEKNLYSSFFDSPDENVNSKFFCRCRAQVGMEKFKDQLTEENLSKAAFSKKVLSFFKPLVDVEYPLALYFIAGLHELGLGGTKKPELAHSMRLRAAEQGLSWAQYEVGIHFHAEYGSFKDDDDLEQAKYWISLAAEAKNEELNEQAQYQLGYMYEIGEFGESNSKEAIKWYTRAANNDDKDAQYALAEAFQFNRGVYDGKKRPSKIKEFHLKKAVHWYDKAAVQGHLEAQFSLWLMSYLGDDFVTEKIASYWLKKAADQGYAEAVTELEQQEYEEEDIKQAQENEYEGLFREDIKSLDQPSLAKDQDPNTKNVVMFPGTLQKQMALNSNPSDISNEFLNLVASKVVEQIKSGSFDLSSINRPLTSEQLIQKGEGQTVEFKETFSLDTQTGTKKSNEIRYASIREICGFLNTNDGTLLIGISDDKEITGIEKDGFNGNFDKYSLLIMDIIESSLGAVAASSVEIELEMINSKPVCVIRCAKNPTPVYCTFKGKEEKVFVRYGSITKSPPPSEWARWQAEKFG